MSFRLDEDWGYAVVEAVDGAWRVVAVNDLKSLTPGTVVEEREIADWHRVPLIRQAGAAHDLALLVSESIVGTAAGSSVALVIDDELTNREYYRAAFEQIGWRSDTVGSASAGLAAFAATEPAVVLVDVRLPDMNGYDVCRQLRMRDRRQCYVVLMSADPTMVEPQRAASAGADLALVGPIGVGQLNTITEQRPPSQVRARSKTDDGRGSASVGLNFFGEPHIVVGDQIFALPAGAATDILSVMAIHHPSVLSTGDLGELAWSPPAASASPVHTALSRLRTALTKHGCPELIVTSQQGYRLDVQADNVDTLAFEKAAAGLDASEVSDEEYVREAHNILSKISDSAFGASSVPAVEAARVRIWEARAVLEERMSVRQILLGKTVEAVATARRLTARELWRESAWTILVAALYHSGRQREALETYQVARNLLVNSVGVDPSPALRDIEQRVLNQDAALEDPDFIRGLAR